MINTHSFHIPVMGMAFTIDAPLKVAHYGIDSVMSIGDDILLEKLRKMYCGKFNIPYEEISNKIEDFRAKRITAYLNLINNLVHKKFEEFKNAGAGKVNEIKKYFDMLPDCSILKQEFNSLSRKYLSISEISSWIKSNLSIGSIDVNIMTKLDRENYFNGEKLPVEFNDAHAAVRGFANSELKSSIVLSAGLNPRLYGYMENFDDFFPDENGKFKKKIILKVSDYRSAFIQGKFLAKKGLWVSEYRIESGLNCGGHTFATDGYLMGPILEEFKEYRNELLQSIHEILVQSLAAKNRSVPKTILPLKITAQGGVGTAEEHKFLLDYYQIDSVGWGTPFLLVPEVTNVDEYTRNLLKEAKEDDLYLSNISPIGVPFNTVKRNSKDIARLALVEKGRPGSHCPKGYLSFNTEFTEKSICTASRRYQNLKVKELEKEKISGNGYKAKFDRIVEKTCLCTGLGSAVLLAHDIDTRVEGESVLVCPGPNMAYFSKLMSLKEITDHIYGRSNAITRTDRPNMFMKELKIYIDFLKNEIENARISITEKQKTYFLTFAKNLKEGMDYYDKLFNNSKDIIKDIKSGILNDLKSHKKSLHFLTMEIENLLITENKSNLTLASL